jgi:hypothetical protein
MTRRAFTIANVAGGDLRWFRLDADGDLSGAALRHARNIGHGGPAFGGPAADEAHAAWLRRFDEYVPRERGYHYGRED